MTRFSRRVPIDRAPTVVAQAVSRARRRQDAVIDLTGTNPTQAGLDYPADLLTPLSDPGGLAYAPQPFGAPAAREAVAGDYARRGIEVDPDRLVLTASTSEAYSRLFALLCDPGDEVLAPRPSYPLLEHLTRLDSVVAVPYDLEYHGVWTLDPDRLRRRTSPRTRAVVLVSPNNPTGSVVKEDELDAVCALCRDFGLALIVDEVFADYPLDPAGPARSALAQNDVLAFSLGGLSKSVGLPQLKLAWMALAGPDALVRESLDRLELICDTYLSISAPVERAVARILASAAVVRHRIHERVLDNFRHVRELVDAAPACELLRAEAGWAAVVRVPATRPEEGLVVELVERDGVVVHPGYFYDFQEGSHVVISLLPRTAQLTDGLARVLRRVTGHE